jgi:hypothetical protein
VGASRRIGATGPRLPSLRRARSTIEPEKNRRLIREKGRPVRPDVECAGFTNRLFRVNACDAIEPDGARSRVSR